MIADLKKLLSSIGKNVYVSFTEREEERTESGILVSVESYCLMIKTGVFSKLVIYFDRNCKISIIKNDRGEILYENKPRVLCLSCENCTTCAIKQDDIHACTSYYWDKTID